MAEHYIGLMSGTSLDGVDGVLVRFDGPHFQVLHHAAQPIPQPLAQELLALNTRHGGDELHRAALAANALVRIYAAVVRDLLAASALTARDIVALGAHGQTVRHQPGLHDETGYTLQLNNPALLAELTGITVVADFRSRDVAAGGQGAPLVPAFHQAWLGGPSANVAVLNLGGISNLTLLNGDDVLGFDCGPGNALLDGWCLAHTGDSFDAEGRWGASGKVHTPLLQALLGEPYFALQPPKSTGRDLFHMAWLQKTLLNFPNVSAVDVQATLAELTTRSCAEALQRFGARAQRLIVCGGGAYNLDLMGRLQQQLPGVEVRSSELAGLPPLQVEATAFAWLAQRTMHRETGNLKSVTGARGTRVLGAIYPA